MALSADNALVVYAIMHAFNPAMMSMLARVSGTMH